MGTVFLFQMIMLPFDTKLENKVNKTEKIESSVKFFIQLL